MNSQGSTMGHISISSQWTATILGMLDSKTKWSRTYFRATWLKRNKFFRVNAAVSLMCFVTGPSRGGVKSNIGFGAPPAMARRHSSDKVGGGHQTVGLVNTTVWGASYEFAWTAETELIATDCAVTATPGVGTLGLATVGHRIACRSRGSNLIDWASPTEFDGWRNKWSSEDGFNDWWTSNEDDVAIPDEGTEFAVRVLALTEFTLEEEVIHDRGVATCVPGGELDVVPLGRVVSAEMIADCERGFMCFLYTWARNCSAFSNFSLWSQIVQEQNN